MTHLNIPMVFVFLGFTVVSGLIAYYCWWVIQKHRRRISTAGRSKKDRIRSAFTVVVMAVPLVGFAIEFIYFLIKTLQEIVSMVSM